LVSSKPTDDSTQWDVWVEGSESLRSDQEASYRLWSAKITNDGDWNTDTKPDFGAKEPSADVPSVREPHVLAQPADRPQSEWLLSYAEEVAAGAGRFGIGFRRQWSFDTTGVRLPGIKPEEVEGCTSLRDPALMHADPEMRDGYWLFFTCERDAEGEGPQALDIRALRLEPDLTLRSESGVHRVLSALDEALGGSGVRAPVPLVTFSSTAAVLRLWFVAESLSGETSIGVATAQLGDASRLAEALPVFELYPANPVLTKRSAPLRQACDGQDCRITGFAVAPHADAPHRMVRFVVAQREDDELDRLVTFEQTWEIPSMPNLVAP
jgi:hypothetical protein